MANNPVSRSLAIEAARTFVRVDKLIDIALAEINMSRAEYLLLSALSQDEMTASVVSARSSVTQANVSLLVSNLLERKLIKRSADANDARRRPLALTATGRARLAEADEICASELMTILQTFAPRAPDLAAVFDAVAHFGEALDEVMKVRAVLPADHTHSVREIARLNAENKTAARKTGVRVTAKRTRR